MGTFQLGWLINKIVFQKTNYSLNLVVLYYDQDTLPPVCSCLNVISITIFRCQWLGISIIAIERYIYVVHPLRYPHLMTKCKTVIGIGICIAIPVIFTMVTDGLIDHKLDTVRLSCIHNDPTSVIAQIVIFIIPSFVITITVSVALWKFDKENPGSRKSYAYI